MKNTASFAAPFAAIDAGSVSIHVLVYQADGLIGAARTVIHEGKLAETFASLVDELTAGGIQGLVVTSDVPLSLLSGQKLPVSRYDARLALIEGGKAACPGLRSILHVGAERFFLLRFDHQGRYLDLKSNSSCAAGTGGFLDQQARRLSLADSGELGQRALACSGTAPKIASRCSVFAKTDLIHAQQEGYSLDEICDGLCRGMAATICDTLFIDPPQGPLLFSGGVSLNRGVLRALNERLGLELLVPEQSARLAARGAALMYMNGQSGLPLASASTATGQAIVDGQAENSQAAHDYPPLELHLSDYPDFAGLESYKYQPDWQAKALLVEVDRYADLPAGELPLWLGIDIGSTSTKAMLIDERDQAVAGFYTRTAGQPLDAVRSIFQAIEELFARHACRPLVRGAATTGSGRKFVGSIIGADLALDEISAHARAAVALAPDIDTILEIGGQDAKFTTLRNGMVTFSRMNTVCAAGTGSFIEEQAQKLGVPLADYAELALGTGAPRTSDRCTVFMERDINHYLAVGRGRREILAATLYSVRENYLLKVADEAAIGNKVCFQGATARNKALVAAFEEKLKQPIFVSRYCHLTGALGCALALKHERTQAGGSAAANSPAMAGHFRGLDLYRRDIPMETETCELCRNHCRIRVVSVGEDKVAFGFLCGRDYQTKRFIAKKGGSAFEQTRQSALSVAEAPNKLPTVGLPYALQAVEEFHLWKRFFKELGIDCIDTEQLKGAISLGKKASGAEFCAPITAFHGHVRALCGGNGQAKPDYLFLPFYLESKEADNPQLTRKYCYYTQFAPSLVLPMLEKIPDAPGLLSPLFIDRSDSQAVRTELWKALAPVFREYLSQAAVEKAYNNAVAYYEKYRQNLRCAWTPPEDNAIQVVLLGRPYTVLSASMNKSIPQLFSSLDVPLYYQDNLPENGAADPETERLLTQIHWHYASTILRAAAWCARTPGIYPVFITSFKCAPDSFVQEYLMRILDRAGKPYLILQLDEHDSNVGYETRIEAAIRAFRNHRTMRDTGQPASGSSLPVAPSFAESLKGKTVLLPVWDPVAIRLVAASLRHAGYDARALEETPELITEGLKTNTGQCIPLNVIAAEYSSYIKRHRLQPENCVLWMIKSGWSCNIGMYPSFIRSLLEREGGDMAKAGVYVGELTMIELGPLVTGRAYFAYLYAGLIHRLACRIRPYETEAGRTDAAVQEAIGIFEAALEGQLALRKAAKKVGTLFKSIPRDESKGRRSKVAIFGDLYLRDNPVMNQDLVRSIEAAGGEVVVIAYTEYTKIVSSGHFQRWIKDQRYKEFIFFRALLGALGLLEALFQDSSSALAGPTIHYEGGDLDEYLAPFHLRTEHEGETYENILKAWRLSRTYPDLSLFVHTSPAFCCPSLVTEALAAKIEEVTGVPVVNIIYDGTSASRNDVLAPYLRYPRHRKETRTPGPVQLSVDFIKKHLRPFGKDKAQE